MPHPRTTGSPDPGAGRGLAEAQRTAWRAAGPVCWAGTDQVAITAPAATNVVATANCSAPALRPLPNGGASPATDHPAVTSAPPDHSDATRASKPRRGRAVTPWAPGRGPDIQAPPAYPPLRARRACAPLARRREPPTTGLHRVSSPPPGRTARPPRPATMAAEPPPPGIKRFPPVRGPTGVRRIPRDGWTRSPSE